MEDKTYYTAAAASLKATTNGVGSSRVGTSVMNQAKARLNREQAFAANSVFLIGVLLFLFVSIWCKEMSTIGFYFAVTINVLLFTTDYWMWSSAKKWFAG